MMAYAQIVLLIVSSFAWSGFTDAPPASPVHASRPQTTASATSARVQTVSFQSQLVGKTLPYNVVLPVNYDQPAARATRYPVLYLLHGLTGHYDNWTTRTRVSEYAAAYEIIIVTPEGNGGWYTDSQMVPAEKYETYIVKELIPDVDRRFRTVNQREGRAIAGLSMGGYGALKFGVKYPAMFAFAGSMSGAPNVASWTHEELKSFEFIWRSLHPVFGDEGSATRVANDVPKLYRELSAEQIAALPYIYLDCGTEDHLLAANRSFAEILVTRKIPHEYRQLPGRHSWEYWDAQVQEVLKVAVKKMRRL
jgi:S-formylglutathione hydrolase FrmB